MKKILVLLAVLALLLTACGTMDIEDVPTAPKITAPTEPGQGTLPLPTDQEGHYTELP